MAPARMDSPAGTPASGPCRRRGPTRCSRAAARAVSGAAAPCTCSRRSARHRRSAWPRPYTLRGLPLWEQGITLVGGCDEVGMAPLAGPVIAAAVILKPGCRIQGVNDSKQLTPEERNALEPEIRAEAVAVGIGRAEVIEIDTINI